MKILMVGDVAGAPGRVMFAKVVADLKSKGRADFVVVNAENAAGGRGITASLAEEMFEAGADVITLGDHSWDQKDLLPYINSDERILRPANFASECPGKGITTLNTEWGPLTVINIIGRVFMKPYDCPFQKMDELLENPAPLGKIILVDIHAEATAEKITLGRYIDGRVTAVVGTHTHVQTSDETILPNGTAYITDLGMTGAKDSSIGRDLESVTKMMKTGMPVPFKIAKNDPALEGIILDVDRLTGKASTIERMELQRRITLYRYEIPWCHRRGKRPVLPGVYS